MLSPRILTLGLLALSVPCAAQATWTQLTPTSPPNGRAGTSAVYDGVGLLFFSGNLGPSGVPSQFPSELWRFDGTTWTQLNPTPDPVNGIPDGRQWYAGAFDFARGVYVIFGGQKGSGLSNLLGDTWEYNVATNAWSLKTPSTSPSARRWTAMSYHAPSGKCVMFGGETANSGTYSNETWTWDGTNWAQLSPTTSPSARGRGKMAYDLFNQEILYSGGRNASTAISVETWAWDGTNWSQKANGPARYAHAIAYDLARKRYVLYGGAPTYDETWEYDRASDTWTQRYPQWASTGIWRTVPAMVYVPTLGKTILFGGFGAPQGMSQTQQNDTWEYQTNALAAFTSVGSGCATSAGVPNLTATALPWIGESLTMEVSNVPATGATFCVIGSAPLTISLGSIGIGPASCVVLVNPTFTIGMPVSVTTGRPTLSLPVPASPALIGGSLLNQALIVDFGTGRSYVSNRGDAVFGAL